MKKAILSLLLVLMCVGASINVEAITRKIVGASSECDLAFSGCITIPTTGVVVCATTSTCPIRIAGDYVVATRMWGTRAGSSCRISNDNGVTWSNCPTLPEPISTSIAGTGDGAVVVAGTTNGGTNCKIQRSIDGGTSWTTVYDATANDGLVGSCSTGSSGSLLKCTIDGECVFLYDSGATTQRAITSSDYGLTWTAGGASSALGAGVRSMAFSGSSVGGIGVVSGGLRAFLQGAGVWNSTAIWAGTGVCWGSIIYNSSARGLCSTTAGTVVHTLRAGATGATDATLTLPDVYPTGDENVGINGMAYGSNTAYIVGTLNKLTSGQLTMGVWATRDNFASIVKLFDTAQPTGALREGDVIFHQGCIWFSGGNVAPMIGKIC